MFKKTIICVGLATLTAMAAEARTINIHGTVTIAGSDEPASGVTIFDGSTNKLLGFADSDGKYMITADSEDSLIFSSMTCQEMTIPIQGRLEINVELTPEATELQEITVQGKGKRKSLAMDDATLDIEGNYIKLKHPVKIPKNLFSSDKRMIIQPAIYNVTKKQLTYMKPVVLDGAKYATTQERMYDWDKEIDPLTPYQQIKQTGSGAENIVYMVDSIYVDNPKDDYAGIVMASLENYNRVIYTDTFEIARGTVNPLRFLDISLKPMKLNDERYIPTAEVELRDTDGEIDLLFPVGKSKFDPSLGNNARELETLLAEFRAIENNPDMSLKAFRIYGSASPEGKYESNYQLANERMKSAMDRVLASIDPAMRRNAEISTSANVALWEDVVRMLRADKLNDEADQVQMVLDRYSGESSRSIAMTRLPFYKSLIVDKYLPRLRRVRYTIVTSCYRPLTDEEIAQLYNADPSRLSKYQFYRYYSAHEGKEREEAMRRAVATHPDFVLAATDLSTMMLERNEDPTAILEPFFADPSKWDRLPQALRYNMAVASMNNMNYSRADSLLENIPDMTETHKAKVYCDVLNGNYTENMQEVCKDSPLNEVLLLLAIKDNHAAWRSAQKLGNTAVEEYVKAVAANRIDDYLTAVSHLNNAFKLDPSLKEIAKVDGDVVDLLEDEDVEHNQAF